MPRAKATKPQTDNPVGSDSKPPLPPGWCWVTLRDIAQISGGITKGQKRRYSEKVRMVPYLRVANVQRGYFDLSEVKEIEATEAEIEALRLQPGDILFNEGGDRDKLGRGWVWNGELPECVHQNHVFRARVLDPGISPKFISFYANSEGQCYFMEHATQTTNLASINLTKLGALPIPLPPASEQRRIVAEVEKQITRLDSGVAALRRIQAELKRYRAAVLKFACEGRIVKTEHSLAEFEKRTFQTAEELVANTTPPPLPNRWKNRAMEAIPGHSALAVGKPKISVPLGWCWCPLVNVARMESGHTPSRSRLEWWKGTIPWIGIADARTHDGHTIYQTIQHTNEAGLDNSAARLLPKGTVCVSRTASVGYVVVMGREMATSQDFVNWIPTTAVMSDWLKIVFSADREVLRRFGKGSVHKTIYFPAWMSVHIALPPLAEQVRIVAEVERRLSVVEGLEALVRGTIQRAARMREAVFNLAFRGKLVEQVLGEAPINVELISNAPRPSSMKTTRNKDSKKRKAPSSKPVVTLDRVLEFLDKLGGASTSQRLFMDLEFGNDVEAFFDLLRQGKNEGVLNVPTGVGGSIRRAGHAS